MYACRRPSKEKQLSDLESRQWNPAAFTLLTKLKRQSKNVPFHLASPWPAHSKFGCVAEARVINERRAVSPTR